MKSTLTVFGCALIAYACTTSKTETTNATTNDTTIAQTTTGFDMDNYETYYDIKNYLADGTPSTEEIQIIDSLCAVVINPTDEQLVLLEERYGDDIVTVADDNSYYQSNAVMILDSIQVMTKTADKRYLRFVSPNQTWQLDIRKEGAPEWNLILFNPQKEPLIITAIDLTKAQAMDYFNRGAIQ